MRQIVNELRGEKVDVVQWNEDSSRLIAEALGPAKVIEVRLDDEVEPPQATVIVTEQQLSLAIGKEGQNARLAARLSGYRVDIRSDIEDRAPTPVEGDAEAAESDDAAEAAEAPAVDETEIVEATAVDADEPAAETDEIEAPAAEEPADSEEPAAEAEASADEEIPVPTEPVEEPADADESDSDESADGDAGEPPVE